MIHCELAEKTSPLAVPALRIGPVVIDPPVLQAPMAGYTNFAFRQIVREFGGAGLLATESAALLESFFAARR